MTENLQKAYDAYQQALVHLRDPKVCVSMDFTESELVLTRD